MILLRRKEKLMLKLKLSWVVLVVVLVGICSCGGGGGSSDGGTTAQVNANGIWSGTFIETGYGTFDIDVLTYNGEIIGISQDADIIYRGTYSVSGSTMTATVNDYEIGGGYLATTTLSISVVEQSTMSGSFSTSYNSTGTISVSFDDTYNRSSSLSTIAGTWTYNVTGYSSTTTINDQGEVSGTNSDGCVITGTVTLLDTTHNLYALDIEASSCGSLNGTYDGLATLQDDATEIDTLTYCVSSDTYIMLYSLTRQ